MRTVPRPPAATSPALGRPGSDHGCPVTPRPCSCCLSSSGSGCGTREVDNFGIPCGLRNGRRRTVAQARRSSDEHAEERPIATTPTIPNSVRSRMSALLALNSAWSISAALSHRRPFLKFLDCSSIRKIRKIYTRCALGVSVAGVSARGSGSSSVYPRRPDSRRDHDRRDPRRPQRLVPRLDVTAGYLFRR